MYYTWLLSWYLLCGHLVVISTAPYVQDKQNTQTSQLRSYICCTIHLQAINVIDSSATLNFHFVKKLQKIILALGGKLRLPTCQDT